MDGFIFTLFWLLLIVAGIGWLVKQMRNHKREVDASVKGAFIHAEIFNAHTLKRYNRAGRLYVFDELISRYIKLGFTLGQHGTQTKIGLFGDWERVDENTIKGMVEFFIDESSLGTYKSRTGTTVTYPKWWGGPVECNLKVGDVFPVGRRFGRGGPGIIKADSPSPLVLKITHIYLPGD